MSLSSLMEKIGYQFKDSVFLEHALSHRSAGKQSNERLEFLGDSILNFIMADLLFKKFANLKEGELSRMRAALVNGEVLAEVAQNLTLHEYLRLGSGELKSGGQHRHSILADSVEALIGAIYLDSSIQQVTECMLRWFEKYVSNLSELKPPKDSKSALQEWAQAHRHPLPEYDVVNIGGQAHAQTFVIRCRIEGLPYTAQGEGASRRKAEQKAARHYLELLEKS